MWISFHEKQLFTSYPQNQHFGVDNFLFHYMWVIIFSKKYKLFFHLKTLD